MLELKLYNLRLVTDPGFVALRVARTSGRQMRVICGHLRVFWRVLVCSELCWGLLYCLASRVVEGLSKRSEVLQICEEAGRARVECWVL